MTKKNFSEADKFALKIKDIFEEIVKNGHHSPNEIAEELMRRKIPTSLGNSKWSHETVRRVIDRIEKLEKQGFGNFGGRRLRPLNQTDTDLSP